MFRQRFIPATPPSSSGYPKCNFSNAGGSEKLKTPNHYCSSGNNAKRPDTVFRSYSMPQKTSQWQASSHLSGKRHHDNVEMQNFYHRSHSSDESIQKESEAALSVEEMLLSSIRGLEIKEKTNSIRQELRIFHCPICKIDLNSIEQARDHLSGIKHSKMCKDINPLKRKMLETTGLNTSEKLSKKSYFCGLCDMELNSSSQADAHFSSKKHQKLSEREDRSIMHVQGVSTDSSPLKCKICDVVFTSEAHSQEHYNGKKHAAKLKANQCEKALLNPILLSVPSRSPAQVTDIKEQSLETSRTSIWSDDHETLPTASQLSKSSRPFLQCKLCCVSVNSESQLIAHHRSRKHLQVVEQMTKRSCGRGRGFMLNQLRQMLHNPDPRDTNPSLRDKYAAKFSEQCSVNNKDCR